MSQIIKKIRYHNSNLILEELGNQMLEEIFRYDDFRLLKEGKTIRLQRTGDEDSLIITENKSKDGKEKGIRLEGKIKSLDENTYITILEQIQENKETDAIIYDYLETFSDKEKISYRGVSAQFSEGNPLYFNHLVIGWYLYNKGEIKRNKNFELDTTSSNFMEQVQFSNRDFLRDILFPRQYCSLLLNYDNIGKQYRSTFKGEYHDNITIIKKVLNQIPFKEHLKSISCEVDFLWNDANYFYSSMFDNMMSLPEDIGVLPLYHFDAVENFKRYEDKKLVLKNKKVETFRKKNLNKEKVLCK